MFEEDARDALIQYLGYSIQPVETPVEEEKVEEVKEVKEEPVVMNEEKPMITAEDLFASSPISQTNETPVEEKEKEVIPENETPAVETPVNEEWNEELKQSIIVGDFNTAVSTCFKYHQYADAFVIAAWGGADLIEKTTVRNRMKV